MNIPFNRVIEFSYALLDKNPNVKYRHFSFIINKGKILSVGWNNQIKTHPRTMEYNYWSDKVHSELSVCLKLGIKDASGLAIVSTRINREGLLRNSRPCPGCSSLIKQLNFKEIWFTNAVGNFERIKL